MPPKSGIGNYGRGGLKDEKARLTSAFCVDLDGSEGRKPLIIGTTAKPHCFNGDTPSEYGYDYHNNDTAWISGGLKRARGHAPPGRHVVGVFFNEVHDCFALLELVEAHLGTTQPEDHEAK
ncbi:unnamed protein product [Rhizoctonia solani]|uniref:DDE-1 domain-containing protein n=1 Tax=Rhizoctonia solani TaxID=456999 RepID=A0A8H3AV41_9AGAM|nr:unnamed protein product [Rhizoctonia solani]